MNRNGISRRKRAHVWEMTEGLCWYCGFMTNPFDDFCIDHVTPLIRGGSNAIENLVPCCCSCNAKKGGKTIDEFRERFSRTDEVDEEPWTHPSGKFFFERDERCQIGRRNLIRSYYAVTPQVRRVDAA